jgi:hypothetical protein
MAPASAGAIARGAPMILQSRCIGAVGRRVAATTSVGVLARVTAATTRPRGDRHSRQRLGAGCDPSRRDAALFLTRVAGDGAGDGYRGRPVGGSPSAPSVSLIAEARRTWYGTGPSPRPGCLGLRSMLNVLGKKSHALIPTKAWDFPVLHWQERLDRRRSAFILAPSVGGGHIQVDVTCPRSVELPSLTQVDAFSS